MIIALSFVPVFTLQAQEGRLFAPLAFTKTYAMAAAAILSVTLVPVLMGYLIRGRIPAELDNPINRALTGAYRPALDWVMRKPKTTLVLALLVFATTARPREMEKPVVGASEAITRIRATPARAAILAFRNRLVGHYIGRTGREIDAAGRVVTPGGVDAAATLREPNVHQNDIRIMRGRQ
mgnify:CR=1 FL=1